MYDPLAVLAVVLLYVGLLFLIALWVERRSPLGKRLAASPVVYTLALAVYCTSWTFYGSVGSAASSGVLFLAVYLGPTLTMILAWFVLRKLVRIKAAQHITSIADLISARYGKVQSLAALATVVALVGTTPYIALQLKSVTTTFVLMTGGTGEIRWIGQNVDLIVTILMVLFTIIFGVRRLDPTERHEGVVMALAVESIVKLGAFLAAGIFVTYVLFNGFGDIFEQYPQSTELFNAIGQDVSSGLTWMTYLVLAMSAILFLPRQFHVAVIENSDERQIKTAMWLFPLYMLLITLFVMPIAVGGLLHGYSIADADTFVLRLPMDGREPLLAMLVFIGGFSAATGMIIVNAMTTATMVTNHLVLPVIESAQSQRSRLPGFLRRHLLQVRWVAVVLILALGYAVARLIGNSYTLVNMGLISFAAVLQFAPSVLGGLFWRRGNRLGAHLGLGAGFVVWAYTLFIPSFARSGWLSASWLENGPWGIGFLRPEHLFGIAGLSPLTHAVFWTMVVNVAGYVLGSLVLEEHGAARGYAHASREEAGLASAFVDALEEGVRGRSLGGALEVDLTAKLPVLREMLGSYFQAEAAASILDRALAAADLTGKDRVSVTDLVALEGEIERVLAGSVGSAVAHRAMRRAGLFSQEEARELSTVYSDILAGLQVSPDELRQRIDYYQERGAFLSRQAEELEGMVAERTRALEVAAQVARATTAILDPDRLIREVVDLIREQFGLYYVGLFLVEEGPLDASDAGYSGDTRLAGPSLPGSRVPRAEIRDRERWAVLHAGTSSAGQAMLERGHRIRIGEGMVGWSIAHGTWRVAEDVGLDGVRLATAELPETRSEAALPLRSRDRVLGALTVQDTRPDAFDENRLLILQMVADQVGVALDNARLFQQSQDALEAQRRAYGEVSSQAWLQMARTRPDWGYYSDHRGVGVSRGDWQPWMDEAIDEDCTVVTVDNGVSVVAIPVRVRGRVVGALDFGKGSPAAGDGAAPTWTEEEVGLLETLAEQLGIALESAQLYADTRMRAARERLLGEVTARVRETLDIETVMRTAAVQIREALGLPEVAVRLREVAPAGGREVLGSAREHPEGTRGSAREHSGEEYTGGQVAAARDNGDGE